MSTNTSTPLAPTAILGTGTVRQTLAILIADGKTHSVASLMERSGSSYDGLRGRLSELRSRNGFVIEKSSAGYTLKGVWV